MVTACLLAAPLTASAAEIYPPSDACSTSPATTTPAAKITFRCESGTFGASEPVTITITGENGTAATFGFARLAVSTGSIVRASTAAGALESVSIALPSDARGVYNIEAFSASSVGGAASVSITAENGTLPVTGTDAAGLVGLWVGAGALVLAGGVLVGASAVRRARRNR